MAQEEITSREYKIMLKASRFKGSEDEVCERAASFWEKLGKALTKATGKALRTKGKLDTIEDDKRRRIRFYDTTNCLLDDVHDYAFRVREEIESRDREMTLKFRQRDVSAARTADMDPGRQGG